MMTRSFQNCNARGFRGDSYAGSMATRGPYDKGLRKRAEILDVALDIVARNGYSGATVKELAEAVGLTHNGVIYYFGSKEALFTEILRLRDAQGVKAFEMVDRDPALMPERILEVIERNLSAPGFIELYSRLSNEASESRHPSHDYFKVRYQTNRKLYSDAFATLRDRGLLPADIQPDLLSEVLLALIDGLQTQWIYDPTRVDMAAAIREFFSRIGFAKNAPITAGST
jgi:AcrR family transcriptional regulator